MLTLVLDRTHAVLMDDGRVPWCMDDGGPRPLRTVTTWFAARGVTLPAPAGSRPCVDGGRDFVFVVDRGPAPPGMAWRPLAEVSHDDALWSLYVDRMLAGWQPPTRAVDVWSFGAGPEMAAQLAHLVACGDKRVTVGWIEASRASNTPLPKVGGVSVVTDSFGYPRVALRSVEVRESRFDAVDAATAADEGEGDRSYDDWHDAHQTYFVGEAATYGLTFTPDALLAVERFEVLTIIGRTEPSTP